MNRLRMSTRIARIHDVLKPIKSQALAFRGHFCTPTQYAAAAFAMVTWLSVCMSR